MRRYSREPTFQSLGDLPRWPPTRPRTGVDKQLREPGRQGPTGTRSPGVQPSLPVSPRKLLSNLARCTRTAPCAARKNFAPLWPRTRQLRREPCSWLPERETSSSFDRTLSSTCARSRCRSCSSAVVLSRSAASAAALRSFCAPTSATRLRPGNAILPRPVKKLANFKVKFP